MSDITIEEFEEDLKTRRNQLKYSVVTQQKYFHLRSVDNAITHFRNISSYEDQRWIYNTLIQYFEKCKPHYDSIDINTSKKLYEEYLEKVFDYYDKHLDFAMYMYMWIFVLIYLVLLIILTFFFKIWISLFITVFLFLFHMFYLYKKYNGKKMYGIFF